MFTELNKELKTKYKTELRYNNIGMTAWRVPKKVQKPIDKISPWTDDIRLKKSIDNLSGNY